MECCGAILNHNLNKIYFGDLNIDIILSATSKDKFWYVINENGTVAGCIGSKEYDQICKTKHVVIKKKFTFINSGENEKQKAIDIFTTNSMIRRIPVIDKEGHLLYEYIKSIEAYYNELKIQCGINTKEDRKKKIVVSLTSYGERLDTVHIAVKSIMQQTLKADRIVLYIAEERNIRNEKELVQAGLTIKRNVKDLKSHKKYFYAVQEFPQSIIITIDDDVIYDDRLLENLYLYHLKFPQAVICRRGHRMVKKNDKIAPYDLWEGCVACTASEKGVCATGVGGILYPCGKYREAFIDEKGILETALYGDDLWLKTIELMNGIETYAIGEIPARVITGSQKEALYKENADNRRNDEYLKKLQAYFNINLADFF